jgi:predicted nucleotidyltransferase
MERLLKVGLVTSRRDGNRLYYQANRSSPVYPELRTLVLKTTGLANVLSIALPHPDVELAFVFGSLAREDARPESDVDLMVLGTVGLRTVTKLLTGVSETLGREINPHVLTTKEFVQRQRAQDHFISSVLTSPRLFIIGSENELAKLGK